MNFFNSANLRRIVNFAKRGCTRLLIHGHHRSSNDGVDKGRFAGVEVSCDEDPGRNILDTSAELFYVGQGSSNAVVNQLGKGRLFELRDQRRGGGVSSELEVQSEDVEIKRI